MYTEYIFFSNQYKEPFTDQYFKAASKMNQIPQSHLFI